jgi:hypothetical protein
MFFKSVGSFIKAFWDSWSASMSGGLSVPFAALGIYYDQWQRPVFLTMAFAFLIVAAYLIWKAERTKVLELTERVTPKLDLFFDTTPRFIAGCMMEYGGSPHREIMVHVQAKVLGDLDVEGCVARLLQVERLESDGKYYLIDSWVTQPLRWAVGEGNRYGQQTLTPDGEHLIDVFHTALGGAQLYLLVPENPIRWINTPGSYRLYIQIVPKSGLPVTNKMTIHWTGNFRDFDVIRESILFGEP